MCTMPSQDISGPPSSQDLDIDGRSERVRRTGSIYVEEQFTDAVDPCHKCHGSRVYAGSRI